MKKSKNADQAPEFKQRARRYHNIRHRTRAKPCETVPSTSKMTWYWGKREMDNTVGNITLVIFFVI